MPHKKPERAEGEEDEENGGELNFEILIKVKVNLVQETCVKCFGFTYQNLKSCKPHEKTQQKTSKC